MLDAIMRWDLFPGRGVKDIYMQIAKGARGDERINGDTCNTNGIDAKRLLPCSMQEAKKSQCLTGAILDYGSSQDIVEV